MDEMPGMIRPDLQALPQVKDRMTFLYLELAQACGQMLDGTFPRTRGGDPRDFVFHDGFITFSPHTRGCSYAFRGGRSIRCLFPAYAGVIPMLYSKPLNSVSFPRIRGGDPAG